MEFQGYGSDRSREKQCKSFLTVSFFLLMFGYQMINQLAGEDVVVVGHSLNSCTTENKPVIIQHPTEENRRIILVDTPGFDDTYINDVEILKSIADWLARSYVQHSD